VGSLLHTLQKHGFELHKVNDGEEYITLTAPGVHNRRKEAIEIITSVDEAHLYVAYGGKSAWIHIILGNDPDELAADWSGNYLLLERLDTAINEYNDRWTDRKCPTTAEAE
jgi:hypothetical protein